MAPRLEAYLLEAVTHALPVLLGWVVGKWGTKAMEAAKFYVKSSWLANRQMEKNKSLRKGKLRKED